MFRNVASRRLALLSLLAPLLLALAALPAKADNAHLSFSPNHASSTTSRHVTFTGFGSDEVLALTFQAPDGTIAQVAYDTVFWASTQDDGTGAFDFVPSDWLTPLMEGQWTVTIVGQTTGLSDTAQFVIDD